MRIYLESQHLLIEVELQFQFIAIFAENPSTIDNVDLQPAIVGAEYSFNTIDFLLTCCVNVEFLNSEQSKVWCF